MSSCKVPLCTFISKYLQRSLRLVMYLFVLWALVMVITGADVYPFVRDSYTSKYGSFTPEELLEAKKATREMFYFAYENYIRHAFPMDELDPINCSGRGY
ncbi:unnamed protein product, partial [Wuchereria bancrofti]